MGGRANGPRGKERKRIGASSPARARIATEGSPQTGWACENWAAFLSERLGHPVRVTYGRSRTAPVQARAYQDEGGESGWELRLHGVFAGAPDDVRDALASWLRAGRRARRAGPVLDRWIHESIAALPTPRRELRLETAGDVHDLERLADPLFAGEFAEDFAPRGDSETPRISWGRRVRSRSRHSLRLGSFEPEKRVVRIHPVLDQAAVPAWFVGFVLKHEILHAVIDAYRDSSGRWVHHGPEFRSRESSWPEYRAALAWERRNLARLIRSAREGTALRVRERDLAEPEPIRAARATPRPPEVRAQQLALPFDDDYLRLP
ncbi:MAG: hypothetical protein AAGA20_20490 [Planctomycetota bacterium]